MTWDDYDFGEDDTEQEEDADPGRPRPNWTSGMTRGGGGDEGTYRPASPAANDCVAPGKLIADSPRWQNPWPPFDYRKEATGGRVGW